MVHFGGVIIFNYYQLPLPSLRLHFITQMKILVIPLDELGRLITMSDINNKTQIVVINIFLKCTSKRFFIWYFFFSSIMSISVSLSLHLCK